jgi:hypothetical protein
MNKYFAIYRVPVATMEDWRKNTSPEEMKAQGEKLGKDMGAWMEKHKASIVEAGYPLGKTKTVTKDGAVDSRNDLNFCQIVEAESHEAATKIFQDNPHFVIPTATIDVMEIPHMGM